MDISITIHPTMSQNTRSHTLFKESKDRQARAGWEETGRNDKLGQQIGPATGLMLKDDYSARV